MMTSLDSVQPAPQKNDVNDESKEIAARAVNHPAAMSAEAPALSGVADHDVGVNAHEMARNLRHLAISNPQALHLHLANTSVQRQQNLATFRMSAQTSAPNLLEKFEAIMDDANNLILERNNTVLGKYTQFITELGELASTVNSCVTPESDGKSNMHGPDVVNKLMTFCHQWSTDERIAILTFDNKHDAEEAQKKFHAGTVQVAGGPGSYRLQFDFSKLSAIGDAIDDGSGIAAAAIKRALSDYGHFHNDYDLCVTHVRRSGMNSYAVQALNLAVSDVQKTYQTDLDLLINDFSRSVSQFDNLVKLYSSLATAMTESCKSFL